VIGNPATEKRKRFSESSIRELLKIKWWDWSEDRVRKAIPDLCNTDIKQFIQKTTEGQL